RQQFARKYRQKSKHCILEQTVGTRKLTESRVCEDKMSVTPSKPTESRVYKSDKWGFETFQRLGEKVAGKFVLLAEDKQKNPNVITRKLTESSDLEGKKLEGSVNTNPNSIVLGGKAVITSKPRKSRVSRGKKSGFRTFQWYGFLAKGPLHRIVLNIGKNGEKGVFAGVDESFAWKARPLKGDIWREILVGSG
ncbi:MAG: hypothetical protein QXP27_09855, partial [Candidatus Methanomethyliaceae archaeon]